MAKADKPETPELGALPADAGEPADRLRGPKLRGIEAIRDAWKRLPSKPGVYRMLAENGDVLYVGKARSLKARVAQYAQGRAHAGAIHRMIAQTASLEVIVTATETEALLLEANLIKRLKPRFNVIMRDDKSFPYILVRTDHPAPAIQKHRGAKRLKGRYFGPFASAGAVNRTLNTLQKAFLLRSCTDNVFSTRTRPCMLHQIKRCSAPCTGLVSEPEYATLVADSLDFLDGASDALQSRMAAEMREASDALEFEKAARLRNRIRALAAVRAAQGVNPQTFKEADVFAIYMEGGFSCVQVFFFRAGQNWGNRAHFPRHESDLSAAEVLESFMGQFYDDKTPPKLILSNVAPPGCELLEEALCTKAGHKVEIRTPERGEKKEIVDQATLNAREAFARRMADTQSVARQLAGIADLFGLPAPPERIEVYDNSHIQGTNAVGAMIVAGPDGFAKNQYRKFNIKSADLTPGDDFGMMREVLRRRFARLAKSSAEQDSPSPLAGEVSRLHRDSDAGGTEGGRAEAATFAMLRESGTAPFDADRPPPPTPSPQGGGEDSPDTDQPSLAHVREDGAEVDGGQIADGGVDFSKERDAEETDTKFGRWPDLVLIDGGEGQLAAARDALRDVGLEGKVTLVGIAKGPDRDAGRERFFMAGRPSFRVDEKSPVLYYLQRLRDEAHRFAIGAHRQRRKIELGRNPLDEIEGVGPSRKRALLERFGSAREVSRAALSELRLVEGVSESLAQRIYAHFNEGR